MLFSHILCTGLLGEEPLEQRGAAPRPGQLLEAVLQLPHGVVVSGGQFGLGLVAAGDAGSIVLLKLARLVRLVKIVQTTCRGITCEIVSSSQCFKTFSNDLAEFADSVRRGPHRR